MYGSLSEHSHLNWLEHGVFWVPLQPTFATSPSGFQDSYHRDLTLLTSIIAVGFDGVSMIICPRSMTTFNIAPPKNEPLVVDGEVDYDALIKLLGEEGLTVLMLLFLRISFL